MNARLALAALILLAAQAAAADVFVPATDAGVKFELIFKDDAKGKNRDAWVTVTRGKQSFGTWCKHAQGTVSAAGADSTILCEDVSVMTNERIAFTFEHKGTAWGLTGIAVAGYSDKKATLLGKSTATSLALKATPGTDIRTSPALMVGRIEAAFSAVAKAQKAPLSAQWQLLSNLSILFRAQAGAKKWEPPAQTLVADAQTLKSGVASQAEVTTRIKDWLQ
ncbi:MAG: hypothetical protein JST92_14250 [Deltaproteobacteria bacterium]|nr:hypothetical protein [Deltaproteobacteria bacterium]